jgi:hypothetical protein
MDEMKPALMTADDNVNAQAGGMDTDDVRHKPDPVGLSTAPVGCFS